MTELIDWLKAQLDEDEAIVRRNLGRHGLGDDGSFPDYRTYDGEDLEAADDYLDRFPPPALLADIEAKRRILDRWAELRAEVMDALSHGDDDAAPVASKYAFDQAVQFIASAYRHRPGYQEAWRP